MASYKPVVLIIMDGFGLSSEKEGNAVAAAKMPNLRAISQKYKGTALQAAGLTVGVPWGEVGNSEVGHSAIGSGQVVYQNLPRINLAIKDGSFFENPVWQQAIDHAAKNKSAIHLAGLVSNGGVHSHMDHLFALLKLLSKKKFKGRVYIHMFTDGRDTATQATPLFLKELNEQIKKYKIGEIATLGGRYYAMDRDQRQERTQMMFDAMTQGNGEESESAAKAVEDSYKQEITDEFIKPTVIKKEGVVKENDSLIFFNFRPDRARQITEAFIKSNIKNLFVASMTQYGESFNIPIAFPLQIVENPIAKVISDNGEKQLHIGETEKYAHITYFLNGGTEGSFPGEDRILIPSPKVASYDLKPEMSAKEVSEKAVEAINKNKYDFIAINFANGDMVGHTGNLNAVIKGLEAVDEAVGKIVDAALAAGGAVAITADHGTCEQMVNLETGRKDTEHTVNPVPLWLVGSGFEAPGDVDIEILDNQVGGILPDVAPTVLEMLELPIPKDMTGSSLLQVIFKQPL